MKTDKTKFALSRRTNLFLLLLLSFSLFITACVKEPTQSITPEFSFGKRGRGNGEFRSMDGIAVDKIGQIYVADVHRIQVFSPQGKYLYSIGEAGTNAGQFKGEVTGIAFTPEELLIASDTAGFRFHIFQKTGEFVRSFGNRGTENGRFLEPEGIVVDKQGICYTVDNKNSNLQAFTQEGTLLFVVGTYGSGSTQFKEPESITLMGNSLYIADEGNGRIQVLDTKGNFLRSFGQGRSSFQLSKPDQDLPEVNAPMNSLFARDVEGLVFDGKNHLYAANEDEGIIEIFTKSGNHIGRFSSAAPGGLRKIQGLATDSKKELLYVVDLGNARVQVFRFSTILQILNLIELQDSKK